MFDATKNAMLARIANLEISISDRSLSLLNESGNELNNDDDKDEVVHDNDRRPKLAKKSSSRVRFRSFNSSTSSSSVELPGADDNITASTATCTTASSAASTFKYRPKGQYVNDTSNSIKDDVDALEKCATVPSSGSSSPAMLASTSTSAKKDGSNNNNRSSKSSGKNNIYDLDGDGILDEVEMAIMRHDINGDGQLDNTEVYQIVQELLKSQSDARTYRLITAALLLLVAILSVSNFGTSWASAILAKDTVADVTSGTVQTKSTGEVIAYQNVAYTIQLEELTEDEFESRRLLVEAELIANPDHEDHQHRLLKSNTNNRNKKNGGALGTKIAYDHGKINERQLKQLILKCEGANTVNVRRGWKDMLADNYGDIISEDYDTICGPGTVIARKGKRKSNMSKTKTKVVDELVTFRSRPRGGGDDNGGDETISFSCNRGECYASGGAITQGQGHPCRLERDYNGASECDAGLVCYHPDSNKVRGNGECTRLQKYAPAKSKCQINFGVDACEEGYACYPSSNQKQQVILGDVIHTGTCQRVVQRSKFKEVCDISFGSQACIDGYGCLGINGREIQGKSGLGYCAVHKPDKWYVNYEVHECVRNCVSGPFCDGLAEYYEETWPTAKECCDVHLWWLSSKRKCVPGYDWGTKE